MEEATTTLAEIADYIFNPTNELVHMAEDAGLYEVAGLLCLAARQAEMKRAPRPN
jgi:hypothetical protein